MRKHDRRRHQFRRVVAGETKHQTLVARALLGVPSLPFAFFASTPCAMSVRLSVMTLLTKIFVGVKHVVVVDVTDVAHAYRARSG